MKKIISLVGISFLLGLLYLTATTSPVSALTLSDISGSPYYDAIKYLTDKGVINGYADGTYKPANQVNRAEFLKILVGSKNADAAKGGNCFSDVKTEWFAPYICYAKRMNVVSGYPDGYFRPSRTINYVEALKIIYLTYGDNGGGQSGTEWYAPYLYDATENKIVLSGVEEGQTLNRGQIAQLVYNYIKRKVEVADNESTSGEVSTGGGSTSGGSTSGGSTSGGSTGGGSTSGGSTGGGSTSGGSTGGVVSSAGTFGPKACTGIDPVDGIYVSPSGNDTTADGTIGNPFKTINAALAAAEPGDTVILRNGNYREETDVRPRKMNITIKSKNGEWGVIDFSGRYTDDIIAVNFDEDSGGGKLQCLEVVGGFYAFSTQTRWDWGEADRSGSSDIIIEDSIIHGSGRDLIKIKPNSNNVTIRRNEIYDSGRNDSPTDCNAEGIDNVNGDNMLVQNNYIHNICSTGVYCKGGATNCIIENNKIEKTGEAGILLGFDTSPEYFDLTVNPNYYENIGGIARNNLIIDTKASGIGMYASKDVQVYNNTLVNVANGEYHSAIYFGVTFQDWDDTAKRPANINPTIHDNVISEPNTVQMPMINIRYSEELGGLSALNGKMNIRDNCYYIAGKSAEFRDFRPDSVLESGSLSQWITHIGEAGSLEVNPELDSNYAVPMANQCHGRGFRP